VKTSIGDLLGYYAGYDDPLSAYMFPRKVSWDVVRSQTQVEVNAAVSAGRADSSNGVKNTGPLGRSSMVANTIDNLGGYTQYRGRTFVTEFDWEGCRPTSKTGQVVVPQEGPFPPQCYGGTPQKVGGSRGLQVKAKVWSLQEGVDVDPYIEIFSETLMRPLRYSVVEDFDLQAENTDFVAVRRFELRDLGLRDARIAFNCEEVYQKMAEAGVLNRGSDCDIFQGMFDLTPVSNEIPYMWSLPHFYQVQATDPTQHPRNNLIGFVTPTGPRYQNMVVVEPESGRIVESLMKEQISVRLYYDERNYFFTKHKPVIIPLYWKFDTKNATTAERLLLSFFQSEFRGLNAGFIACVTLGAVSLMAALFFGMLLYRENSLQTIEEKRKRIQAELASAVPSGRDAEGEEQEMRADFD